MGLARARMFTENSEANDVVIHVGGFCCPQNNPDDAGLMMSASSVIPFGLPYMWPLQNWLKACCTHLRTCIMSYMYVFKYYLLVFVSVLILLIMKENFVICKRHKGCGNEYSGSIGVGQTQI